jgi:hypothetical protein
MTLLFQFLFSIANAAACCGGGMSAPALLVGDDQAQMTGSYSAHRVSIDLVDENGIWHKTDAPTQTQTFKIEAAYLLADRWQAGISIPVIQRQKGEISTTAGVGDVSTTLGYEYLPDWNYHPYRPKGLGFLQITTPLAKSKAESELGGLDSRGQGFWSVGLGTLLSKSFVDIDIFTSLEVHQSFAKKINTSQFQGTLKPGRGYNLSFGGGYNFKDYRLGGTLTSTYEDAVDSETQSGAVITGSAERYTTAALSLNYSPIVDWSAGLSYSNQTWFGDPQNTSMGESVSLVLQHRWPR